LEAQLSLVTRTAEGLREQVKKKNVRSWKPITDGHEKGKACWVGLGQVERSRVLREKTDQENRERLNARQTKKDEQIALRAHVEARRARKRVEGGATLGSSIAIPIRGLAGMPVADATPGAGPSNYAG